jgi:hypothetical protein
VTDPVTDPLPRSTCTDGHPLQFVDAVYDPDAVVWTVETWCAVCGEGYLDRRAPSPTEPTHKTLDTPASLCHPSPIMPRAKAPKSLADAAPPPALDAQLDALTLDPEESVASRLLRIGPLVASAQAAGVYVSPTVLRAVPTLAEIAAALRRVKAVKSEAEAQEKILRDYVLAYWDSPAAGGQTTLDTDDPETYLNREFGSRESINPVRLVELGVDPDVIDQATDVTPFFTVYLRKRKAVGTGNGNGNGGDR